MWKIIKALFPILVLVLSIVQCSSNGKADSLNSKNPKVNFYDKKEVKNSENSSTVNGLVTNIYLENSGSMFGYVSGNNDFINVVSTIAADCELFSERVNFSMLNATHTQLGVDLQAFLGRLNPQGMSCGSPGTSDLNSMFERMLDETEEGKISILISDGIYSVPSKGSLLGSLQAASLVTRNKFIDRLEEEDLVTFLIKFNSHFEGRYFNYQGLPTTISQSRPYYVWVVGTQNDLKDNFDEGYFKNLPSFQQIVKFVKLSGEEIKCQYVLHKQVGEIRYQSNKSNVLNKVRPGKENVTRFSIAFDFSKIPYSDEYFMNKSIYQDSTRSFQVDEVAGINVLAPTARIGLTSSYTHVVTFSKNTSPWGKLVIEVKDLVPSWIEETNEDNDNDIVNDTTHTLGFKYLIDGISKAYDHVNDTENLYKATFLIKYD